MTDWVNGARTMSICEFTPRRVDRSWSRPRPTMVAALIGPVYTSGQTLEKRPKVPFSATVQLARRGVGSAELVRQVASRQADRDWRVPRRAIQKARGTLNTKSATSFPS